jgi:hypothetical protein
MAGVKEDQCKLKDTVMQIDSYGRKRGTQTRLCFIDFIFCNARSIENDQRGVKSSQKSNSNQGND